jgi:hypothetical protein
MLKGVNVHQKMPVNNDPNYYFSIWPLVIDAAWTLGFRALRCDFSLGTGPDTQVPTNLKRANMIAGFCRDRGMKLTAVLITPFLRTSRTDGGNFPDNATGRYNMGFNLTQTFLQGMIIKPDYIELDNEITINVNPIMTYNQGGNISEYNVTKFNEIADVLKGQYDAVRANAPNTKIIVGTLGSNFAFIPWLISKGIDMDVAGYHAYFNPSLNPLSWQDSNQNLSDVFYSWNKPVTINEFNGFPGDNSVQQAAQALRAYNVFSNIPLVESLYVYELFESAGSPGYSIATQSGNTWSIKPNSQSFINKINS